MTLIREPVLRGVREVNALLFDGPTAAADAIGHWEAGATLLQLEDGSLVVRLAKPISMRCELGRGLPLVAIDGRLVALPLDQAIQNDTPAGALVRLKHGRLVVHQVALTIDPPILLDLSGWQVEMPVTGHLHGDQGEQRPAPAEPPLAVEPATFDPRVKLGHQPEPTRRDRREWRRLQRPKPAGRAAAPRGTAERAARPTSPPLLEWLRRRRQRKYLDDLTRLFAAGDLDAALRKAIPFGGESGPAAAAMPQGRRDLTINPNRQSSSGVVSIEAGLRAELDHRYRAAFARLEGQGRILDAAFVMADLLDRTAEACRFLERHGELRLAAELAEARTDDHPEIVRLWWRAGERDRAVAIARRHSCFSPAIVRLERRGDGEAAAGLRRLWMAQLLDAGDVAGAYDAGTGLDDEVARSLRRRLIDLGVERGGPLRARMLARQLRAGDDSPHPALAALLDEPSAALERETLLAEITATRSPVNHPEVVRSLVRHLLTGTAVVSRETIEAAVALSDDAVLSTDLPPLSTLRKRSPSAPDAVWVEIDSTDRGQLGVNDARLLADGRLVVAIDGIGVRVLKPSGRVEADFDLPADQLIPADNGLRILALSAAGDGVRSVATIAVPERRVRHLGEVAATRWADTFDGANWFLANHSQLWMLDMLADGPMALWRQTDHREPIVAVSRSPRELAVASAVSVSGDPDRGPWTTVVRRYTLPSLVELAMDQTAVTQGVILLPNGEAVAGDAAAGVYRARVEQADTETVTVVATQKAAEAPIAVVRLGGATRATARIDSGSLVVFDDCGRVEVVDLVSGGHRSVRLNL